MGFFANLLDPVLRPLLNLGPIWAVIIISVIISIVFTIVQKYATDQKKMKGLKKEMKESQKRMKELKSEPAKMMVAQKESMKKNMEYMKLSFRATLFTIIPILIVFSWMNANLAFAPILPGEEFSVGYYFEENFRDQIELKVPNEIEILKMNEIFMTKTSLFGGTKKANIDFSLNSTEDIEKIYLKGLLVDERGDLKIYFNGELIYDDKINKDLALKLPRDELKRDNMVVFESASPGLAFWRTNSVTLEDISIILDKGEEVVEEVELEVENDGLKWALKGEEGDYFITFEHEEGRETKEVIITHNFKYAEQVKADKDHGIIKIDYDKLRIFGDFNIKGWYPGWLALYIALSLVLSLSLRKILKLA